MESPLMIGQQPIQCNRTAMKSSLIPQAMTYTNQPALDLTIWELPDRPTGVIYLPIEWETIIQNCSLSHPSCANSCPVVLSSILIASPETSKLIGCHHSHATVLPSQAYSPFIVAKLHVNGKANRTLAQCHQRYNSICPTSSGELKPIQASQTND